MKTSTILRASLLTAAFGAALSAQAVTIGLSSVGTNNAIDVPFTFDETVVAQQGGYGPLGTLHLDGFTSFDPFVNTPLAGTYTGPGGTLTFSGEYLTNISNGDSQTLSGTWTATGGSGTYAGATGGGTLANVIDVSNGTGVYPSFTTFRGNIEAVPEPASMAALGLGALGLLRRRKN